MIMKPSSKIIHQFLTILIHFTIPSHHRIYGPPAYCDSTKTMKEDLIYADYYDFSYFFSRGENKYHLKYFLHFKSFSYSPPIT